MKKAVIVGLGDVFPVHLDALQRSEYAVPVALCDIEQDKEDLAVKSNLNFYTNMEDAIKTENADCVHLCLPHYLHLPMAEKAAALGCNVFTEKPLALNTHQALEFMKLEEKYNVKIGVCFQNRKNKTSQTLYEILQRGKYGNVLGITGIVPWARTESYYAQKPWRGKMEFAGGGCMINQAIHTLDLMQWLVPAEIENIRGQIGNLLEHKIDVEDSAFAHFKYNNGATGLFMASVANYNDESVSLKINCEKAVFEIKNGKLYKDKEETPICRDDEMPGAKHYYGASHFMAIEEFYKAMVEDTNNYIHPDGGLMSVKMIDAIRESSNKNCTVKL